MASQQRAALRKQSVRRLTPGSDSLTRGSSGQCSPPPRAARQMSLRQTGSQIPYSSNGAAPNVDLARFEVRIVRAMRSSARPRADGRYVAARARSAAPPKGGWRECNRAGTASARRSARFRCRHTVTLSRRRGIAKRSPADARVHAQTFGRSSGGLRRLSRAVAGSVGRRGCPSRRTGEGSPARDANRIPRGAQLSLSFRPLDASRRRSGRGRWVQSQ